MSKAVTNQKFGGLWSLLKIETVADYLRAFNTALRKKPSPNRPFRRIYIDAFAGSGDFSFATEAAPLLDVAASVSNHSGSAKRALETTPPFDALFFIERLPENVEKLKKLTASSPSASVILGDANAEVRRICAETQWASTRGVIFLDPFGTEVDWETLKAISGTEALDVWYLFPLSGLYRNAPHDPSALDASKRRTLTRILGTENWEQVFYAKPNSNELSLFPQEPAGPAIRSVEVEEMESFVRKRLKTLFPTVLPPKRLYGPTNAPMFSLFFAVSNPSAKARKVAGDIAQDLINRQ